MGTDGNNVQSVRCPPTISRPDDKLKWAMIEAAPPKIEGQLDTIAFEHQARLGEPNLRPCKTTCIPPPAAEKLPPALPFAHAIAVFARKLLPLFAAHQSASSPLRHKLYGELLNPRRWRSDSRSGGVLR